jgi:hypothetical protein
MYHLSSTLALRSSVHHHHPVHAPHADLNEWRTTMSEAGIISVSVGIDSVRLPLDNATILGKLGLLRELAGTWQDSGFNLIARPDFHDKADLYLQLNQTRETLKFDPINEVRSYQRVDPEPRVRAG